jgi:hypothetical protein
MTMDHKEERHLHHQKEREHEKAREKQHEQEEEKKLRVLHPAWFLVLGIVLVLVVVLGVWTLLL